MSSESVQLVCFDVGGVLLRICRSWDEGCDAAGIDIRHERAHLRAVRSQWHALVEAHQTGLLELNAYARQVSALLDGLYSPDEIESIHHAWLIAEYDGVGDVIDMINAAGIRTAALSNTNDAHWSRMPEYPVMSRLHALYASHELGLHKPDEAIYRAIELRSGHSGGRVLFFDDLEDNVSAAQAVGWRAVLIDPHSCTATQIRAALHHQRVLPVPTADTSGK